MGSIQPPPPNQLRLAIFECDTPLPQSRSKHGTYGGMFEALLSSSSQSKKQMVELKISKYQVDQDEAEYPDLRDVDVVLITGSKHSAYMDIPWINKLVSVTYDALQTPQVKVIGVCFGHQIIGRALGAPVNVNNKGWEVAVLPIDLTPAGKGLVDKDQLNLQFSHQDIVISCPQGVQNLGSTPRCAVQGMYQPGNLISLQGHPEFDEKVVREILTVKHANGLFDQEMYDEGVRRVALDHDGLIIGRLFWRFMLDDAL